MKKTKDKPFKIQKYPKLKLSNEIYLKKHEDFVKAIKESKLNKKKIIAVSQDILDKLYDNPKEFFDSLSSVIISRIEKGTIMDLMNTSIFIHYCIAMDRNKNDQQVYKDNLITFFTGLQQFFSMTSIKGDTFLHYFSECKNKDMFFFVFFELDKANLLSDELLLKVNSKEKTCIDYIVDTIKIKFERIIKDEKFQKFCEIILKKYPKVIHSLSGNKQNAVLLYRVYCHIVFDCNNEFSSKKYNFDTIKTQIKNILSSEGQLINSTLYLKEIKFNFLNYLTNKRKLDDAKEVIKMYIELSSEKDKTENKTWIVDHLLHLLITYTKDIFEYVTFIVDTVATLCKENEVKNLKYKRNCLHYLFLNEKIDKDEKKKMFDLLCDKI